MTKTICLSLKRTRIFNKIYVGNTDCFIQQNSRSRQMSTFNPQKGRAERGTQRKNLKRSLQLDNKYPIKRKKRKQLPMDTIRKLINCQKGEAIQALHMVFNADSFSFETRQESKSPEKFISYLNVEGYSFIGYGNTKMSSRSSASKIALMYLIDDLKDELTDVMSTTNIPLLTDTVGNEDVLADAIAALVLEKYENLKRDRNLPWFKVLSGIVMIRENDYRNGEVLILATGTKCIEPRNVQSDGTVVIDSHAEILTKRAFQYYLLTQLELHRSGEDSILVENDDGMCKVRKEISFYIYVSSAPCGDCRIFTISGRDDFVDKHPNRISRGVLRIKLDGGNSTVPVNNCAKYEADKRLMIMSCSDKILKMNVLGMQGALLSNYIEPVYLTGIVIGDLFQKEHVTRALYGRIETSVFTEPFRLNKISIRDVHKQDTMNGKSPKSSINWIRGEPIEITHSTTGKTETKEISRLCKRRLFERFMKLKKQEVFTSDELKMYEDFKIASTVYQKIKNTFYDYLENRSLGRWIRRNVLDRFSLVPI